MGDSPAPRKTSISYEDTWNTNEPYDSDFWDECDPAPSLSSDSPAPCETPAPSDDEIPASEGSPESQEDSDDTITENEEIQLSSESAVSGTPVASQVSESTRNETGEIHVSDIPSKQVYDMSPGKYRLIGWNLNMTGNRLIDEICQISGYTLKENFNLFVMPHGNPNNYLREHYGLQIATSGPYRTMRDIISRRFLKTRSELSSLTDFISWLETVKGETDGVVLIFHDIKKLVPLKILQCLKQFNLLDKFKNVVKGFCNICTLAESRTGDTKYFSLKVLSNVLLPQRNSNRRGSNKARTCHDVLIELLNCAPTNNLNRKATKRLSNVELIRQVCDNIVQNLEIQTGEKRKNIDVTELIYKYSVTVNSEEVLLVEFEEMLERQNSFRTLFKDLINFDQPTRQLINRVRRKIVNQKYCFQDVENVWKEKKCLGLEEFFNNIENITEKEFDFITEVFERHFDPKLGSYLEKLVNERNKQKKVQTKQEVQEDLNKSLVKLPKIVEENDGSAKGHRRVKSF